MKTARNIELIPLSTRLPPDVKAWLDKQVVRNVTSLNAEIVAALRAKMEAEKAGA